MKQILILILFISSHHFCFSQVDLKFFKSTLQLPSYDELETKMKDVGYIFDEAKTTKKEKGCVQYYIFGRLKKDYYDGISILSDCSENEKKKFLAMLLITPNNDLFYKLKTECKTLKNIKTLSESIKGEAVVNKYSDDEYIYTFNNGKENGNKVYSFTIEYK